MKLSTAWHWELGIGILEDNVIGQTAVPAASLAERRREPRISLSLPVRYRRKGQAFPWQKTHSLDVSRNGVRLALPERLSIGSEIDLDIKLPEQERTIRLQGVIVWINPSTNTPTVECGVAFKNLRKLTNREKIIYFMADRICGMAVKQPVALQCRPVRDEAEMETAFRLLYREYLARGYCLEHESGLQYNFHVLLPDSKTFVLEREGSLLGTISLFPDPGCGLPMETLFPKEIEALRGPGRKLAEVGLLALDRNYFPRRAFSLTDFQKLTASFRLFKVLFDYARLVAGVTDLVIGMHPKHQELYQYLGFKTLAPPKLYPGACGNPALPMHLDIYQLSSQPLRSAGRYFFSDPAPVLELQGGLKWTRENSRPYLWDHRCLAEHLPSPQRAFLERIYGPRGM
jgi:Tfp pilus assembly protein PilZ